MGQQTYSRHPLSTSDVSYHDFKNAVITLHRQGTAGAAEGDYTAIRSGMQLLNEWGNLFPGYASQLADDPDFLN
ncbi:MAG TPA: hypothetical protein VLF59_04475 [Candidatus Saccharimonadales bacterium]|nr:hypothetical protein [Candidatus Saccharimonadales bacterium]